MFAAIASLPILGQRGRALIEAGWLVVGCGARGETWAAVWEELEWTIVRPGSKRP
jgi:hypothetical protein